MGIKSVKKFTGQLIKYEHNAKSLNLRLADNQIVSPNSPVVLDDKIYFVQENPNTSYSGVYRNSALKDTDGTFGYDLSVVARCSATVAYQGVIYVIGGLEYGSQGKRILRRVIISGSPSVTIPSLPQDYTYPRAVVSDNKIHLFGGDTNNKSHYTWDGVSNSWTLLATELPMGLTQSPSYGFVRVDGNGNIHIFYGKTHYQFVNGSWVQKPDLPFYSVRSIIIKGTDIHVFDDDFKHCVFNGTTTTEYDMPIKCSYSNSVLLNNKLVIVGGTYAGSLVYYLE